MLRVDTSLSNREAGKNVESASCYELLLLGREDKGTRITTMPYRCTFVLQCAYGNPPEGYPGLKTLRSERRIGEPPDSREATAKA